MKSMTGYGRGSYEKDGRTYVIEVKSVNHKYNEMSVKLPRTLSFLEENIRKEIRKKISRGKIDIFVNFLNYSNMGKKIIINNELVNNYINQINSLCSQNNITNNISVMELLKLPEVLTVENQEEEEILWNELNEALKNATNAFLQAREQEGNKIKEDLIERISKINTNIKNMSEYSVGLVNEYIAKLEDRIKELLKTDIVDQIRLAQEVVIYSDKCSIEEELTRIKSHIIQFQDTLEKNIPVGKNLDFIVQEMNRELNTIGSKANKLEITKLVIDSKTILEDIREQIQNIE